MICGDGVIGGNQDVGKRFVVAQQHIEARPQPLDQVGFEQQRFGLGPGGDEFDIRGRGDHAHDARVVAGRPRIGDDALFDVLGLADIEHVALRIDHAIDAGRRRRVAGMIDDRVAAGSERDGDFGNGLLFGLRQSLIVVLLDEIDLGLDVGLGAVVAVVLGVGHGMDRKVSMRFGGGKGLRGALRRLKPSSLAMSMPVRASRTNFSSCGQPIYELLGTQSAIVTNS